MTLKIIGFKSSKKTEEEVETVEKGIYLVSGKVHIENCDHIICIIETYAKNLTVKVYSKLDMIALSIADSCHPFSKSDILQNPLI